MMVSLSEVIASNERISSSFPDGLVAVFVGGTSGVGEYTVKAFVKHVSKARIYVVGRSQDAADRIIGECKQNNPDCIIEFIKADVSLLKTVDDVCRQIRSKEESINILFESQGTMAFETSEGLLLASSIVTHSRLRFILNLLPLIQKASSIRRVISVLAATCEGAIDTNNLAGEGFPQLKWRNQTAAMETLLLEEVARRAPDVSFIHTAPGIVKGGITRDAEGFRIAIFIALFRLLGPFVETPPDECGERHVFIATSAMFSPRHGTASISGVPLGRALVVTRGSDGHKGSGVYSIDNKCESASPAVEKVLLEHREDSTAKKVWDYVMADFKKITGTEAAL
ncbi:putative short-chain dehydrogenases/reductase [Xylogone sp. PMI_703]|nr:putative short-chain dehydrogenases/reductase [Xylogone sp. PMI_703]